VEINPNDADSNSDDVASALCSLQHAERKRKTLENVETKPGMQYKKTLTSFSKTTKSSGPKRIVRPKEGEIAETVS
jgi:hypothetical protein